MAMMLGDVDAAKIAGNYDLEETIGKGHYAVVKSARHVFTGERVAVKIIDKTKLDRLSREHLFQEVICMKLVQHPHVVRLYEVIDTAHKLYLIQEWGDGGDLYDYIMRHEGGVPEPLARKYFGQIINAIDYCHKLHVVHRDLKPENVVFFKKLEIVKLTDFGFSNKFTPGSHLETSCGSLAYSAPEILLGDSYDPPKVDIWSLGVILYMLVCGQLPFQEANDSETLTKIMDCHYIVPPNMSSTCQHLLRLMLCRDPSERASLPEILAHPWFQGSKIETLVNIETAPAPPVPHVHRRDSLSKCCQLPFICQHRFTYEEHMELLNLMADGNIATQAEIQAALDEDRYDYLTATYFLLAERKLRRRHTMGVTLPPNLAPQEEIIPPLPQLPPSPGDTTASVPPLTVSTQPTAIPPPAVQAGNTVRILSSDSETSGAPEDRLRRFSMILEDQEEDDEVDSAGDDRMILGDSNMVAKIIQDEIDAKHVGKENMSEQFEHRPSISAKVSTTQHSVELGEFIEMNSQGVATLRYSKTHVASHHHSHHGSNTSSARRRRRQMSTLNHVHSMPQLLQGILEESLTSGEQIPFFLQARAAGDRRPTSADCASRGTATPSEGVSQSFSKPYWRNARNKRRSLPPMGTTSPVGYQRQRKSRVSSRSGASSETASTAFSKSQSNSSDGSDIDNVSKTHDTICNEDTGAPVLLPEYSDQESGTLGGTASFVLPTGGTSTPGLSHNLMSANSLVVTLRSGTSSGINLRETYAPIHEDMEMSPDAIDHAPQTNTDVGVNRFHHSFSMTPTPNPSGWHTGGGGGVGNGAPGGAIGRAGEYGRRRSDIGHATGGADTPVRYSGHDGFPQRVLPPVSAGPGLVHMRRASGRSMSQSNFSLSTLANSLRASKIMMEVIRGTYELQLHQQRPKVTVSLSSSKQNLGDASPKSSTTPTSSTTPQRLNTISTAVPRKTFTIEEVEPGGSNATIPELSPSQHMADSTNPSSNNVFFPIAVHTSVEKPVQNEAVPNPSLTGYSSPRSNGALERAAPTNQLSISLPMVSIIYTENAPPQPVTAVTPEATSVTDKFASVPSRRVRARRSCCSVS